MSMLTTMTWLIVYVCLSSKLMPQFTDAIVQLLLDEHLVSVQFAHNILYGFFFVPFDY